VESKGLEGEPNLLFAAFRLAFRSSIRMGGLGWGRIGLVEVMAWLGADAGAGVQTVGLWLHGFRGGFLTEDQGLGLD